jgi:integrase
MATRTGLPSLNTQTVNSHLTKVATLFNWAVREEWVDKNPASGLSIDEAGQSRREPFSVPQLQAMFTAPLFTGCRDGDAGYAKPGSERPRNARFWVPLLSLFHGLRLNEACQLRPEDIVERDGVPAIFVRSADASQRVKSRAGTRIVPLHPEMIGVGFLGFVIQARIDQKERLFPELSRDARGYYSDAFQKWFSRFLGSCDAIGPGKSFHCFRHGWVDRLREAGLPEDRRRALGGWANTGVDAGYGRGFPTRMLADDIARVAYPGLELGPLRVSITD